MTHKYHTIEDTVYFWFGSNDTSGSGDDGSSPVFDVRLAGATAGAAPVLSGSATLLTHADYPDGSHEVAISATAANGFSANNEYSVFCTLLVDSQNPTGYVGSFSLKPIIANTIQVNGTSQTANDNGADINTILGRIIGTIASGTHNPQSGDAYSRLGSPAGASIAADLLTIDNYVDELESRLTAARAGYLDELSSANIPADVDAIKTVTDSITDLNTLMETVRDGILNAVLSGATYNISGSVGRRIREIATSVIITGTSPNTGGTANTTTRIELDNDASSVDGAYDPCTVSIIGGTGIGQSRQGFQYEGTNKYLYVNRDWKVVPDDTSEYVITNSVGDTHVNEGVAQGGTVDSITLNALASSQDNVYRWQLVFIVAGTGADQAGIVHSYNGTTKVASVYPDWIITPDDTSVYAMLPLQVYPMRGTDGANTTVPDAAGTASSLISALNDFDPANDTVARVTLVDTTTANTDMRGTDNANTVVPDVAGTAAALHSTTDALITTVDAVVDAIKLKTDNLPSGVAKNVALANFPFMMVDETDHITPETGLTVTATISKDGGAFASCTNSVTEISSGIYRISLTQTEMNADVIILKCTATGADQRTVILTTS